MNYFQSSFSVADMFAAISEHARRADAALDVRSSVSDILADIRVRGDGAVSELAARFDSATLDPAEFRLTEAQILAAGESLSAQGRAHVAYAHERLKAYAEHQRPASQRHVDANGSILEDRYVPVRRVACYIPGGTAPLVSTALHTVAFAKAAGVPEIVAISPPTFEGSLHPATIHAAHLAGATEIYRLGGVYGIAAMAFGTSSIRKVDLICGPGNAYVQEAKRQVFGAVAVDMIAGPSEVLVIADEPMVPGTVATDLLAQLEHGTRLERAFMISTSQRLCEAVYDSLKHTQSLGEARTRRVNFSNIFVCHVASIDDACELSNLIGPEHLELSIADPRAALELIVNAGAVFLGQNTPESVGDFIAGPSHVLPPRGGSASFSGLSTHTFMKRMSVVEYTRKGLEEGIPSLSFFADTEGLPFHKLAATERLN